MKADVKASVKSVPGLQSIIRLCADGWRSILTADKAAPDLLVTATDGLGRVAEITYKPLTDPSVYSKGSGASFPELDLVAPLYVVASVSQDDGQTAPAGGVEGDATATPAPGWIRAAVASWVFARSRQRTSRRRS
jgi:hypothetical protein